MTDDDELLQRLRSAQPPVRRPLDPTTLAARGRKRRAKRRAFTAGSLAVVIAAAVTTATVLVHGSDPAEIRIVASPSPAAPSAPAPLVFDGMQPLACGVGSLSALSATPGVERADTPEAAALREALRTGIAGEVFPPKTNWVVLARQGDKVIFGHREGRIGIGDTVIVHRVGAKYELFGSGGCGPIGYANGRQAARLDSYRATDGKLVVSWTGGTCSDGSAPIVQVAETAATISVLVISPPDKILPVSRDAAGHVIHTACGGTAIEEHATVPLKSPVGTRHVEDAAYYPAVPLS